MRERFMRWLSNAAMVALLCASPSLALSQPTSPQQCLSVDKDRLAQALADGQAVELTPSQLNFARGIYVASPPVTEKLPQGSGAVLLSQTSDGEDSMIIFLDGLDSCERIRISQSLRSLIEKIGKGEVAHRGDGV